ncbi:hypothetical protein BKA70DRAFT_1300672 [Coprinopsis sp. MPI-PUGE-AT-0042]|nr:hypothetical protein BKA70DRAFT_1300672 [Coprinopsis sp. MPI-PUGE-AT-0042]
MINSPLFVCRIIFAFAPWVAPNIHLAYMSNPCCLRRAAMFLWRFNSVNSNLRLNDWRLQCCQSLESGKTKANEGNLSWGSSYVVFPSCSLARLIP